MGEESRAYSNQVPLVVDLDGTLIKTDLLIESFFSLLKGNPLYLFFIPFWLAGGKANLKHQIAIRAEIDPALLPYRSDFLEHLRSEKEGGRELILATASHERYAQGIAHHLGLFSRVFASNAHDNLKGPYKRDRLVAELGEEGFVYAADDPADLAIWSHSAGAVLVDVSRDLRRRVSQTCHVEATFDYPAPGLRTYIKAMRLHQWLKNLLIFLPLAAAHQVTNPELLVLGALAFLSFGLCASSVYLLNDLLDLPADRSHPRKCKRPFASGDVSLLRGIALIPVLLVTAFALAALVGSEFVLVLAGYYVLTLAYSLSLKRIVLVDVMVLAALYTTRIIAGSAATQIEPSFWLLAFSMFLFLSLAMVKRVAELTGLKTSAEEKAAGRGYHAGDLETLTSLGTSSGYMAVLVLALYINSENVTQMYTHPEVIWLILPMLLYWISRMWMATTRDKMHDDPLVYAIKERVNQLILLVSAIIILIGV